MRSHLLPILTWLLVGAALGALLSQRDDNAVSPVQLALVAGIVVFFVVVTPGNSSARENAPDANATRWDSLMLLGASLALAGYAQYLSANRPQLWYIALLIDGAAMLLFVQVIQKRVTDDPQPARASWVDWTWRWLSAHPLRNGLLGAAVVSGMLEVSLAAQTAPGESFTVPVALWLASMFLFVGAFIPWETARTWRVPGLRAIDAALKPHLAEILLVIALVAFAFLLRGFDLENIPINLGGDESEMGLEARRVLAGKLTNPFATGWYSHPTLFFFLQSWMMRWFGETVVGLRMLSALLGTLTVLAAYLLARQLHGQSFALAVAFLLSVYPYHIQFSRIGLNNIADAFWTTTVFFLTIRAMMTRRIAYFVAGGLALGVSQYFYHGVRLIPVMLVLFLGYWLITERKTARPYIAPLAIFSFAALIAALPLIGYYFQFPAVFTERYQQMGIFPSGWLEKYAAETGFSPLVVLAQRTVERFSLFNFIPDLSGFYAPGTPLLETFSAILFVFGLTYSLYHWKERAHLLFVLWFVCGVIFGSVLIVDEAGSARTLTLTVPIMFFLTCGIFKLAEAITTLAARPRWSKPLAAIAIVLLACINVKFYYIDYVPKRTYAGYIGWTNTEMAKYLLRQPGEFRAYFFGPPYDYLSHATIAYLAPNLNGLDILEPLEDEPAFVDHTYSAIFLFLPLRAEEFTWVQQAYPDGERTDFTQPDGTQLFFAYYVSSP
ncbi:MAG: glycosyltransferase family 39 protein [Chloroflexi bacterium]|nr:glycosyltransferase family 39 protein [Chloroflexota bacterium]